jgi:hypothetical protein
MGEISEEQCCFHLKGSICNLKKEPVCVSEMSQTQKMKNKYKSYLENQYTLEFEVITLLNAYCLKNL